MKGKSVKAGLKSLGVKPSRERGQNFLIDHNVIDAIVEFGAPSASDNLVEIGPGLGALTERLVVFPNFSVIEIEGQFCRDLALKYPDLKIINSDVRKVDFSDLGDDLTVFGNLPYVYSTDILFHLIRHASVISRAVLLLQKEFAERVASPPGGRSYGSLSVASQVAAKPVLGPVVPGTSFHPPTKVESRLLKLEFFKTPRYKISDPVWFTKVVRAGFLQRRKKLLNSLKASGITQGDKFAPALERAGIDPGRRAETLSIEEFIALADGLKAQ